MKLKVTTLDAGDAGEVSLSEEVFGVTPRADILARVVQWQENRRHKGQHRTLTRSEIDRTTKKMYKQKGTGQARHGAQSVAQFRGGAKAMGPVLRSRPRLRRPRRRPYRRRAANDAAGRRSTACHHVSRLKSPWGWPATCVRRVDGSGDRRSPAVQGTGRSCLVAGRSSGRRVGIDAREGRPGHGSLPWITSRRRDA